MAAIKKKYIVDEGQLLEDYVLCKKMSENEKGSRMQLKEAKAFYSKLKKS